MEKTFHIGDVLSCTTGCLVSPRLIDGVYDVLGFMHGIPLFTHQLRRACDDAKPFIFSQHPNLQGVDASGVNRNNWREWLSEQITKFGEQITLTPIPNNHELHRNPLAELEEMVPADRIIPAILPEN